MKRFWILLALLSLSFGLQAATFDEARDAHDKRLKAAIDRLAAQRDQIADEKVPIAREIYALEREVLELRRKADSLQSIRDSKSVDLETLRARVLARQKEFDYISRTLLDEYLALAEASLSPGELAVEGELYRVHHLSTEREAGLVESQLSLLRESHARLRSVIGLKRYEGEALNTSDVFVKGTFFQLGPVLYFSGQGEGSLGLIEESLALKPRVRELDTGSEATLAAFVAKGEGTLPLDPSLGTALKIAETEESVAEHLEKGGLWVFPILGFAVVATLVAIFKFLQLLGVRASSPTVAREVLELLRADKSEKALELARKQSEPQRSLLVSAVEHAKEAPELIEEMLYEQILSVKPRMERFLNVIAVTAATAPLLGLLGTVTGIIKTFKLMTVYGTGDPRPLISGISEALITTELGLILAIPALVLHALLSRKVAGVLAGLEKLSLFIVNNLARQRD